LSASGAMLVVDWWMDSTNASTETIQYPRWVGDNDRDG
jgi:hypothetical protein